MLKNQCDAKLDIMIIKDELMLIQNYLANANDAEATA